MGSRIWWSAWTPTTAGPAPQVTVDQLKRELSPLVGASPFRGVQTDEALKRARASLAARAVANVACLDILGKATRASVYEILGGPTRHKVRAMAVLAEGRLPQQDVAVAAAGITGLLIEGLIGPLAPDPSGRERDIVQSLTLAALRSLGVADARARGLVVQTAIPSDLAKSTD